MPQPTDCYCNVTPHGCLNCIRRKSQEENRELSQNLAPHHVRPQFLKSIFTPDDFAFLRSEIVRVSSWLRHQVVPPGAILVGHQLFVRPVAGQASL